MVMRKKKEETILKVGAGIDHVAIWVNDLEQCRDFYTRYFGASSGELYQNPDKNFSSYFLTFPGSTTRLELMHCPDVPSNHHMDGVTTAPVDQFRGFIHLAFSLGNRQEVSAMTERLRRDGYRIIGEPRTTGDGYFESVILDPEGNMLELTA